MKPEQVSRQVRFVFNELYKRDNQFLAMLSRFEARIARLEKKGSKGKGGAKKC
jgi:hypothetical protein